jgi:hypothetical protein
MKPKLYMVIEELEEPRYDGATNIRWGTADNLESCKDICSFLIDADTGIREKTYNFLRTLSVWYVYSKDKVEIKPFLDFCKENNVIFMHSKAPWAKKEIVYKEKEMANPISVQDIVEDIHIMIRLGRKEKLIYELADDTELIVEVIKGDEKEISIERINELGITVEAATDDYDCDDECLIAMVENALLYEGRI